MKIRSNILFALLSSVCMAGFMGIGAVYWGHSGAWFRSVSDIEGYMGTEAMGIVWALMLAFMAAAWCMVLVKTGGRGGWGFALLGALSALYSFILFEQQSTMGALMLSVLMAANIILLFYDCVRVSPVAAAVALPPGAFFGYVVYISYMFNTFA